jgi:hypothetical protein
MFASLSQRDQRRNSQNTRTRTVHRLADKVLLERPVAFLVVLQRDILHVSCVSAHGCQLTRYAENAPGLSISSYPPIRSINLQHRDIPKDTLKRLVEDIAHLVLKVLRRDERVDEVSPKHALERDNLAARAADRRIDVERFPQVIDAVGTGLRADVEEDTDAAGECAPDE